MRLEAICDELDNEGIIAIGIPSRSLDLRAISEVLRAARKVDEAYRAETPDGRNKMWGALDDQHKTLSRLTGEK